MSATSTNSNDNPNNCDTCHHSKHGGDGWCYMFREEPHDACMQHSAYQHIPVSDLTGLMERLLRK